MRYALTREGICAMANVLPEQYKEMRVRAFRARLVLVASLTTIAVALVTVLFLVPAYIAVSRFAPPVQAEKITEEDATLRSNLLAAHVLAAELEQIASSSVYSSIVAALAVRPATVSIDRIDYSGVVGGKTATIMLGGSGAGRAVIAFRDALVATGRFSNISIPINTLVGEGGSFSITMNSAP